MSAETAPLALRLAETAPIGSAENSLAKLRPRCAYDLLREIPLILDALLLGAQIDAHARRARP